MSRVVVLATGGTISSRSGANGAVPTDSAVALVEASARDAQETTVETLDVLRKNSFNLSMADLRRISSAIAEQFERAEVDGVVVTHGTDTLEESAYLADLVHSDDRPAVFTGAQRAADHPASDGPENLADAVAVAASPEARGRGVLVVFAGSIFAARGLQKVHSVASAPFAGRGRGTIGTVVGGQVRFWARPERGIPLAQPSPEFDQRRVDAVLCYPGSGSVAFDAILAAGARGIVIEGTGTGNPSAELIPSITEAIGRGVIVALGTRVADGPVVPTYGGGGAVDAVRAGALTTGTLPVSQARILLALLLDLYPSEEAATRFTASSQDG